MYPYCCREIHIDICGSGEDNWPFDMDYRWGPTGANGDPLVWWAGKNKEVLVAGDEAAGDTLFLPH